MDITSTAMDGSCEPQWLDSDSAFCAYCESLPAGQAVAIDTEFDSSRCYYPQLALVQFGVSRESCAIADPLMISDWQPLAALLADETRRKIFFSGANDLPLLVRACGGPSVLLPRNIFDVQVACGFYGKSANLSLKNVILGELGIELAKSETLSDWMQRPLTAKQLQYAAGDVALLPQIAQMQEERMRANGNWEFFVDEMRAFEAPEFYGESSPEEVWERVRGKMRRCSDSEKSQAHYMVLWREFIAVRDNITRNHILRDDQLIWVVQRHPRSTKEMHAMPFVRGASLRIYGDEIIETLQKAPRDDRSCLEKQEKQAFDPNYKAKVKQLTERIMGLVEKRAQERQIDSALLAAKHHVVEYINCRLHNAPVDKVKIATGWRAKVLQPTLGEIL